uniref:Uncharacterized protein n=1 Tax=Trypanosoma congolense (strain IL3000) TaxID=1068625 RepID=G0US30_TRYCI|nr:hypothetical protein, unlikely [Trypanosoma congolense IL3000]
MKKSTHEEVAINGPEQTADNPLYHFQAYKTSRLPTRHKSLTTAGVTRHAARKGTKLEKNRHSSLLHLYIRVNARERWHILHSFQPWSLLSLRFGIIFLLLSVLPFTFSSTYFFP